MNYNITAKHMISRWDEAVPLGNGEMGCLIWGSPAHLRFSLDRVDVWDTTTPAGTEQANFNYKTLVHLAKQKDTKRIREIFDAPYYAPIPTKLPVGKIILHLPQYEDVASTLSLTEAQAVLQLSGTQKGTDTADFTSMDAASGHGATPYTAKIKSIIHSTLGIGIISVSLPLEAFSIELQAPEFGRRKTGQEETDINHAYCTENREISQGNLQQIIYSKPKRQKILLAGSSYMEYFQQDTNSSFSYGVVMGVIARETSTELYYRITTSKDSANWLTETFECIRIFMDCSYDELFTTHVNWWKDYWAQCSIRLPDTFLEKNWYISNYLLASCSRKGCYPMPLQGVWTADEDTLPPWKGDYHNDLNTQMSYYSYLKANHIMQGSSFVDFLWNQRHAGRTFAKNFYETEGLCLPAVMTIDGKALGGWPMYSLSPTNQIWLCKAFDDYYRYTGDKDFLFQRAYPYFQETEACIGALLTEGMDGYLYLPISSSPEIHDDESEAFLTPNSNYDLSLLHYLYQTLEEYASLLHIDKDYALWSDKRQKLSPLAVDDRGVFMLSSDEILTESHRHFSHAHGIHPLRLIKYDTDENRRRIDATIQDLENLGTDMWVGFSFCWMAELYAISHKGNQAAEMLRIFWEFFCSSNGFHLNGDYKKGGYSSFDYRPFTLEANMCAADALQEMLLYTEENLLEPFVAIPDTWMQEEVAFEHFRGHGGIQISSTLKQGHLVKLLLKTDSPRSVTIKGWNKLGLPDTTALWEVFLEPGENLLIG